MLYLRLVNGGLRLSVVEDGDAHGGSKGGVKVGLHLVTPLVGTHRPSIGSYATGHTDGRQVPCFGNLHLEVTGLQTEF